MYETNLSSTRPNNSPPNEIIIIRRNFLGELSKQSCRFDEKKKNKKEKKEKRILMKNGFSLFSCFFLFFFIFQHNSIIGDLYTT
jgi:Fe2+ transport system protein B